MFLVSNRRRPRGPEICNRGERRGQHQRERERERGAGQWVVQARVQKRPPVWQLAPGARRLTFGASRTILNPRLNWILNVLRSSSKLQAPGPGGGPSKDRARAPKRRAGCTIRDGTRRVPAHGETKGAPVDRREFRRPAEKLTLTNDTLGQVEPGAQDTGTRWRRSVGRESQGPSKQEKAAGEVRAREKKRVCLLCLARGALAHWKRFSTARKSGGQ